MWVSDVLERNNDSNLINFIDIVMFLNISKNWDWSNLEIFMVVIGVVFLFSVNGIVN